MATLKRDTPPDFLDALSRLEATADECWRPLAILDAPANTALWALLVGAVASVEHAHNRFGPNTAPFDAALLNTSRSVPIALKWAVEHGKPATGPTDTTWSPALSRAVDQALAVARQYFHFEACFPAFHKNFLAVEILAPALVRFTTGETDRARQVTAHRQGRRPLRAAAAGLRSPLPTLGGEALVPLMNAVLGSCRHLGPFTMAYDDPFELWAALLPQCLDRLRSVTRRSGTLSLGDYSLDDFNHFFAALLSVCAAHDLLCFRWSIGVGVYPLASAVLCRPRNAWVQTLSVLSGVAPERCEAMLSDMTFPVGRSGDLHVQPFVPLSDTDMTLALAPPFPMHSRHDENILRVCSQLRPRVFAQASLQKEGEMRVELQRAAERYIARGPLPLPGSLPDIDLLVVDDASSTVAIVELKWIRKTARPVELPERDAEVLKGVDQLHRVREFCRTSPEHLASLGALAKPLSEYRNVSYLVVARDHWRWVAPADDIGLVEFDAFAQVVAHSPDLHSAIDELLRYEWLPAEDRDFVVRYERATANGVSIESEVLFAPGTVPTT